MSIIKTPLSTPDVDGPSPTGGLGDHGTGTATPINGKSVRLTYSQGEVSSSSSGDKFPVEGPGSEYNKR